LKGLLPACRCMWPSRLYMRLKDFPQTCGQRSWGQQGLSSAGGQRQALAHNSPCFHREAGFSEQTLLLGSPAAPTSFHEQRGRFPPLPCDWRPRGGWTGVAGNPSRSSPAAAQLWAAASGRAVCPSEQREASQNCFPVTKDPAQPGRVSLGPPGVHSPPRTPDRTLHLNGFTGECTIMWVLSVCFCTNVLKQMWHW